MTPFQDHLHLILHYDQSLGFYHWEKKIKQKLTVELKLAFDLKPAIKSDHLKDTVDYDAVDAEIRKVFEKRHYNLIERMAEDIAQALLSRWSLKGIAVTVNKPLAIGHAEKSGRLYFS